MAYLFVSVCISLLQSERSCFTVCRKPEASERFLFFAFCSGSGGGWRWEWGGGVKGTDCWSLKWSLWPLRLSLDNSLRNSTRQSDMNLIELSIEIVWSHSVFFTIPLELCNIKVLRHRVGSLNSNRISILRKEIQYLGCSFVLGTFFPDFICCYNAFCFSISESKSNNFFYVHGTVYLNSLSINIQQNATIHNSSMIGTGSSNGWIVPDAVNTVIFAPDDGWRNYTKHVEQFTDKINCVYLRLVGYLLTRVKKC